MTQTVAKLEWKGVCKRFDGPRVLDGFDLRIEAGRSLVIIGGSGQGKSVSIKVALGLIPADSGQVLIDGVDVGALGADERRASMAKVGMLFQGAALFDSLTVWENVAFRLLNAEGMKRREAKARAIETLGLVRLGAHVADLYPSELSGGMQKRVGLARAIIGSPDILFFDEPTTGLDPITAAAIDALIVDRVKSMGSTAVSITHDLPSARRIADEIAMLHKGKIIWRGHAAELDTTDNPYVRQFVDGKAEGPIEANI